MSRDRALQLAPASLALLLCKAEGAPAPSDCERGSRLFQDFQAANARCFWNRRLVRAVAEVCFQGWLDSWVLLLQGHPTSLEVLRDAWVRRALRPPRGFTISALGDVSPVQMSPVSQSQFIPLAEVLCCAISDMNDAQILVTQESLMEQLIKHHPGIATPSQEILYSTLGTLIKERKIYHTGEGYFIVTPQTYFITKKPFSHKCGAAEDLLSASPPAVTYLVSMESCADLTKANAPSVSHCRSCSCFSENSTHNILGQQSINESHAKEHRSVKDSKPSVQNQATSTSRDHHTCAKAKTQQLSLKEKEKCNKKFGISLFWRNVSKKEKSKKELVSFSAQFPPEEWPVRDEDNLDNIPRDIEHEIIKRINPVLTVDNLMKHTQMMQKLEEQKRYFSKGTSTDIIRNKNGHAGKGSGRKKNSRMSKYHKKLQASKEKSKKDSCGQRASIHVEADVLKKSSHQTNGIEEILVPDVFTPTNPDIDKHKVIYKKQIQNPFEGIPYRDNANVGGHKSLKEIKRANTGKNRNPIPRSKSLDCPGSNPDGESRHLKPERPMEDYYREELFQDQLVPNTDKVDIREYSSNYPECSTLRIDDKFKQNKEQNSMYGFSTEGPTSHFGENATNVSMKADVTWEQDRGHSYSSGLYCAKVPSGPLQHGQINLCKNRSALKGFNRSYIGSLEEAESEQIGCYTARGRKGKDPQLYPAFNGSQMEAETENHPVCFNHVDNEDASSSFIEGDTDEHLEIRMQNMDIFSWNPVHEESHSVSETSSRHWELKRSPLLQFASSDDHNPEDCSHSVFSDSSKSYTKPALHLKGGNSQPLSPYLLNHSEVEVNTVECSQTAELVDASIFDYCNSSECNSMAETVQTSIKGSDEKHAEDPGQQPGELRKCYERSLTLFNTKSSPQESSQNENHSITGDSGIESPRTRISLASSNSAILETLKKKTFLQNLDLAATTTNNEGLLAASSLMQLTPAMNV
ncbi:storkhead-box protein 1 [Gastrophryne carolinensis]